jgi:hypothetical protein
MIRLISSKFICFVANQQERGLGDYKNQAKLLVKRLTDSSPARCTIDTGNMCFQYVSNDK